MKNTIFSDLESRPIEPSFFLGKEEYINWYKWRQLWSLGFLISLVTNRGNDIVVILDPDYKIVVADPYELDIHGLLYMGLKSPYHKLLDLAKMWSQSGYYKSMHLNQFLNGSLK